MCAYWPLERHPLNDQSAHTSYRRALGPVQDLFGVRFDPTAIKGYVGYRPRKVTLKVGVGHDRAAVAGINRSKVFGKGKEVYPEL